MVTWKQWEENIQWLFGYYEGWKAGRKKARLDGGVRPNWCDLEQGTPGSCSCTERTGCTYLGGKA